MRISTRFELTWTASPAALFYLVYRGTTDSFPDAEYIGQANQSPYKDWNPDGCEVRFYFVVAGNQAGPGGPSEPDTGRAVGCGGGEDTPTPTNTPRYTYTPRPTSTPRYTYTPRPTPTGKQISLRLHSWQATLMSLRETTFSCLRVGIFTTVYVSVPNWIKFIDLYQQLPAFLCVFSAKEVNAQVFSRLEISARMR